MRLPTLHLLLSVVVSLTAAKAVEDGGSYNTSVPTETTITNWSTGWATLGITGWSYVGTVNGASGVYLGNNWVLTAGHVGAGDFTLGSTVYQVVNGSAKSITDGNGTADLTLFQIASAPDLLPLTIATSAPTAFSRWHAGSSVAMIGYGGGQGETWGLNTVTAISKLIQVGGYSFTTVDFETAFGTTSSGTASITNTSNLVVGDSGGGDFIYDSTANIWTLAGINEAVDGNNSYMVQLGNYATQINTIRTASVPEPGTWSLLAMGVVLMLIRCRFSICCPSSLPFAVGDQQTSD